jgi:hypothetical protein
VRRQIRGTGRYTAVRGRMRPQPKVLPDTDRRFVTRVAQQPYPVSLGLEVDEGVADPRAPAAVQVSAMRATDPATASSPPLVWPPEVKAHKPSPTNLSATNNTSRGLTVWLVEAYVYVVTARWRGQAPGAVSRDVSPSRLNASISRRCVLSEGSRPRAESGSSENPAS